MVWSKLKHLTACHYLVSDEEGEGVRTIVDSTTLSNSDSTLRNALPAAQQTNNSASYHQQYAHASIGNPVSANASDKPQHNLTEPPDQHSATAPGEAVDRLQGGYQGSGYSQGQGSQEQHSELTGQEYQQNTHQQPQRQAQYAPLAQTRSGLSEHAQWSQASVVRPGPEIIDESRSALSHAMQRNDLVGGGIVTR